MNRRKLLLLILVTMIGVSIPVYGKETALSKQGNITVRDTEICNMKEDYLYLEQEIFRLLEECN